jgi:inosine-uridine nucleoside N-ribohydrolase
MKKIICLIFLSLPVFGQKPSDTPKQKIIFDCDLGDDIDDAYALGLLLTMQDHYEILGITTCYGRTEDRAILAAKFLKETHQNIPIYAGRNTSGQNKRANWFAEQFYWSQGFNPSIPIKPNAAEFIKNQLNRYPGEVVIFSVGPVTNMADVMDLQPNILNKAKAIYAMFGSFRLGYDATDKVHAEWNVVVDIPSAKKFVNSGANIIYAGLDVTAMVKLDANKRAKLLQRQSPLTNVLSGLYVLWGQETPTLFDPVAIGMEAYPDLFKTEDVHIRLDDQGFTRLIPNEKPNARIGIHIDHAAFIERIMQKYLYQNL